MCPRPAKEGRGGEGRGEREGGRREGKKGGREGGREGREGREGGEGREGREGGKLRYWYLSKADKDLHPNLFGSFFSEFS